MMKFNLKVFWHRHYKLILIVAVVLVVIITTISVIFAYMHRVITPVREEPKTEPTSIITPPSEVTKEEVAKNPPKHQAPDIISGSAKTNTDTGSTSQQSNTPTDAPSDTPTDAPSDTPTDEVPTCTVSGIWAENVNNPLANGGGTISGTDRVYYPSVIKTGSTYHLWYGDGVNTRHAVSTSPDFNTASFPAPIVTGLVKTSTVYHPMVLYNSNGWTIGGTTYPSRFLMYSAPDFNQIRVSYSDDGDAWTDIGSITGPVFAPGSIYDWIVLKDSDNTWKAYGVKLNATDYYTSTDGLAWTQVSSNVLSGGVGWESKASHLASNAFKIGGTYYLYYNSGVTADDEAIGLATSLDGVFWTKSPSNPIFSKNDGIAWRNSRTYTAFVLRDGATCRMYYSGKSTATGKYTIGVASQ